MTEPVKSKGDQTRAALVEAAFTLFSRQGYHGTTVRQIADQVGLTPGSLYNHFSGKDEIFLAVIETYHPLNQIVPLLNEGRGERTSRFVRETARHFAQVLEANPGLMNLALIELVELDGQHMPALVDTFRPQVMAFIERLEDGREPLQPISPFIAFRIFLGLLFAYELTGRLLQSALGPEAGEMGDLDDFIDIYLHGILRPAANEESKL